MYFLLVLFSRFLIGQTKKVILSKQDDILIQTEVGELNSNDSLQVCIALKWLKLSVFQHILRTVSVMLTICIWIGHVSIIS